MKTQSISWKKAAWSEDPEGTNWRLDLEEDPLMEAKVLQLARVWGFRELMDTRSVSMEAAVMM